MRVTPGPGRSLRRRGSSRCRRRSTSASHSKPQLSVPRPAYHAASKSDLRWQTVSTKRGEPWLGRVVIPRSQRGCRRMKPGQQRALRSQCRGLTWFDRSTPAADCRRTDPTLPGDSRGRISPCARRGSRSSQAEARSGPRRTARSRPVGRRFALRKESITKSFGKLCSGSLADA